MSQVQPGQRLTGRNLCVFADGTGNSAAALAKTNVWRLYRALDLSPAPPDGSPPQIAYYSNGVGTSSFRPLALLGGVFGIGLSRNVREIYKFLCRNYQEGDRIYAFGFSRGAFTIRILCALVADQGIHRCRNEEDLERAARDAYRSYRRRYKLPLVGSKYEFTTEDREKTVGLVDRVRNLRDLIFGVGRHRRPALATTHMEVGKIRFVGVWDTVAAYGLPIDELTRGVDEWVWPLSMPNYQLSPKVQVARHALALDEERDSFRPLLWDEDGEPELSEAGSARLLQVWFAGVHANVGGGYPDDTLSYVPLQWIMDEAEKEHLRFSPRAEREIYPAPNPFGQIYDSRAGVGAYYRYQPRKLRSVLFNPPATTRLLRDPRRKDKGFLRRILIHHTVFDRVRRGDDGYAPLGLAEDASILTAAGTLEPISRIAAPGWESHQEWVWNDVWRRRVNYFATVGASFLLVLLPAYQAWCPPSACQGPQCLLSPMIWALGGVLPGFLSPWIDAFAKAPLTALVLSGLIFGAMSRGSTLKKRIRDGARKIWLEARRAQTSKEEPNWPTGDVAESRLFRFRTTEGYQSTLQAIKWIIAPNFFGATLLFILVVGIPGLVIVRSWLVYSEQSDGICATGKDKGQSSTRALCWNVPDVRLVKDNRYRITLIATSPWWDKGIPASPAGIRDGDMPWYIRPFIVLRRTISGRWYQPTLRIKQESGLVHLQPLDFVCTCRAGAAASGNQVFEATVTAEASGSVSVFVNDAALGLEFTTFAYDNNSGGARVTVEQILPPEGQSN